jgi:YggT family protein
MTIVCIALQLYGWILFARIILSWVTSMSSWTPPLALQPILGFIYDITDPVMSFVRRFIPPLGPIDISPLFIFLALTIITGALCR